MQVYVCVYIYIYICRFIKLRERERVLHRYSLCFVGFLSRRVSLASHELV